MANSRFLNLRWVGICQACALELEPGTRAWWDADTKRVTCFNCRIMEAKLGSQCLDAASPHALSTFRREPSGAGGSADREYERRKANYEASVVQSHPRIGRFLLKVRDEPQPVAAWAKGAEGERRVGSGLDRLASDSVRVLHDRRIPGSRANIDHLVIAPSGVYVIDTKQYTGKVEKRDKGGLFRADLRLYVGNRDRSKLLDGMARQREVVRRIIDDQAAVLPVLCFVEADWKLFGRPFEIAGVTVIWPRALFRRLRMDGRYESSVDVLASVLQRALPRA